MRAKKGQKGFAGCDGVLELNEQELDSIIGGAGKPQEFEVVVDTPDARITEFFTSDGSTLTLAGTNKTTFKGKHDPFYKKNGSNIHIIDMSNLK